MIGSMERTIRGGFIALLLASAAWAQNPADVSVTLAVTGGKNKFRVGEAVEVELRFQSSARGRYAVSTRLPVRNVRRPEYDQFSIEPAEGVADPLKDVFAQIEVVGFGGPQGLPNPLGRDAIKLNLWMNEWLSIRQPGHYRVSVETTRVVTMARPVVVIPLRSNTVEIDVIAPELGWAAARLKEAVTELERPDPRPAG
jgi:hypothetical protein